MTLYNLAAESCTITGTTATLKGALAGYLTFAEAGVTNGATISYSLQDIHPSTKDIIGSEVGRGTYSNAGTVSLDTVLDSTNSGSHISIVGDAQIIITALAEDVLELGTGGTNASAGNHAHSGTYLPVAGTAADSDKLDGQHASAFEPADATIVKTGQTNWIDLTDGGATTLHTHAAEVTDHAAVTLDANADTLLSLSTQALGLDTQTANTVLAGRVDAGAALVPTFRSLVAADIPALSYEPTISILTAAKGGTGINNGTNNLTVPATGTAALLGTANVFTALQTINVNSLTGLLVEQTGVKSNVLVVDTTNARIGINVAPAYDVHAYGDTTTLTIHSASANTATHPATFNYFRTVASGTGWLSGGEQIGAFEYYAGQLASPTNIRVGTILVKGAGLGSFSTGANRTVYMSFSLINAGVYAEKFRISGTGVSIGGGTAGVDYTLTFDGETNDGVITWMEDEDYFQFQDDVLFSGDAIGFFGVSPVARATELTDELTTVTFTAPGTPDYAIQDLTNSSGFGFVTKDEGNTVLSVIANLQTRVNELETKLAAYGLLQDAD
jgi:hypothetical protein